jgi:hypothetical protein
VQESGVWSTHAKEFIKFLFEDLHYTEVFPSKMNVSQGFTLSALPGYLFQLLDAYAYFGLVLIMKIK